MRIDLHVHSRYSEIPRKWFMRTTAARESYTEPETIYRLAKAQGMTHVTITDHNRVDGVLRLRQDHPDDVLTGMEATVFFPEDRCYFHLLIWGLEEDEFTEIQRLRSNVYALRDYLVEHNLAHAVAHAVFGISRRLSLEHVEKLLLLFNTFEGINSGRSQAENEGWTRVLRGLTPETIERLRLRHGIEPVGGRPWMKGLTGGSDDHAGLFVARAYTESPANTTGEFLDCLRANRGTEPRGESCDCAFIVFSVARLAYEYTKDRNLGSPQSRFRLTGESLFDTAEAGASDEYGPGVATTDGVCSCEETRPMQDRLDAALDQVVDMGDRVLCQTADTAACGLGVRALGRLAGNIPAWFAASAAALPFVVTIRHVYRDHKLLERLAQRLGRPGVERSGGTLVFCDMPTAGGRVPGIEEARRLAAGARDVMVVTSVTGQLAEDLAPHVVNLPAVARPRLPGSEMTVAVPSLLGSLNALVKLNPGEVVILSPGPLGLLGLLLSRLLRVRCTGVMPQAIPRLVLDTPGKRTRRWMQRYVHWFYGKVPVAPPSATGPSGRLSPQLVRNR